MNELEDDYICGVGVNYNGQFCSKVNWDWVNNQSRISLGEIVDCLDVLSDMLEDKMDKLASKETKK